MGMKTSDLIRKILFPHECFTFYFWDSLLSFGTSVAKAALPALAGTAASYLIGGGKEADEAMEQSSDALQQQNAITNDQWNLYKQNYLPLEQELIAEVRQGINPDIDGVTGRASADVVQSFDKTRESTNRTLGRYGINPNSGRFASSNRALDIAQASTEAKAVNDARTAEINRAEDVSFARRAALVNAGKGLASGVSSNLSNISNSYQNMAGTYGNAAASTGEFVASLPWNDLFKGNSTQSGAGNQAIPTNTI